MLKYFVSEEEREASHSTCYFEFQQGYYRGQCWLSDSISINGTLWDKFDLSNLFERVIEEFDYFDTTVVTKAHLSCGQSGIQRTNRIVRRRY